MTVKLVLVAACALIDADGRVLIAQRPEGKSMAGLWEFPGGKVEPGEQPEQSLIRELKEELGITVKQECLAPLTFASHLVSRLSSAHAPLCLPALGRFCRGAREAEAQMGAAERVEELSDAASR